MKSYGGEEYTLRDVNKLRGGDHFCGLFHSEEERLTTLAHFVRDGLRTNCKVILIEEDHPLAVRQLKQHCSTQDVMQIDEALAKGQLAMETPGNTYFKDRFFTTEEMVERLMSIEKKALEEGYRMVFVSGEPAWLQKSPAEYYRLFVKYVSSIN